MHFGAGSKGAKPGRRAGEGSVSLAQPASVGRSSVWREVLGTRWIGASAVLSAIGAAEFLFGWSTLGLARLVDGREWLCLVLASLLAAALEGSHRAVARREAEVQARRQEIDRLVRTPQRRLAQAKFHLYRDAFMCTQIVGFLMMTRMEGGLITPETALGIERAWGGEFLERIRRMFGTGRSGDVFSNRMGGHFPPPRDQATAVYAGLADYLTLLAERITESDLDAEYLHGRDEGPAPASGASAEAHAGPLPPGCGAASAGRC
jgi:hypothetical protein